MLSLSPKVYGQPAAPEAGPNVVPSITWALPFLNSNTMLIFGAGLKVGSTAPKVSLGGTNLTLIGDSATLINANIPANLTTGTYGLKVTTSGGTGNFDVTITEGVGLTLPYSGTANSNNAAFVVTNTGTGDGVWGIGSTAVGYANGVYGQGANGGTGVAGQGGPPAGCGEAFICSGSGGVFTGGGNANDDAVGGHGVEAYPGSPNAVGILAESPNEANNGSGTVAAVFYGDELATGNLEVDGSISKGGGSFRIDHPIDPANKFLYHSFVESPDMMNVYNGNVMTDNSGHAMVTLPAWFEALNRDYRYQLTVIGQPAMAWVASKILNDSFLIKTDKPNVEVSWQVTGIRQDAWANAHRIPLEVEKSAAERGHYIYPELFGHPGEPSIAELHHPRPRRRTAHK